MKNLINNIDVKTHKQKIFGNDLQVILKTKVTLTLNKASDLRCVY